MNLQLHPIASRGKGKTVKYTQAGKLYFSAFILASLQISPDIKLMVATDEDEKPVRKSLYLIQVEDFDPRGQRFSLGGTVSEGNQIRPQTLTVKSVLDKFKEFHPGCEFNIEPWEDGQYSGYKLTRL